MTKYGFDLSMEVIKKDIDRLTNQVWKLIPMFENKENWKKQLYFVKVEIAGLNEIFQSNAQFLQLLSKLEGLYSLEEDSIEFENYRGIIFESISILQGFKK